MRSRFLPIPLLQYRLHVIVTWETTVAEVAQWATRHGVTSITAGWRADIARNIDDDSCSGLTARLGDRNDDVLVWLRHRPRRASEYGTLYHELFHAVQAVARSRNLGAETESPAFLYEYLATRCNRALWPQRRQR